MKLLPLSTFTLLAPFFVHAAPSPQESLGLALPSDLTSNLLAGGTESVVAIGTASGGLETTFLYNEVEDFTLISSGVTQTTQTKLSGTLVASASGFDLAVGGADASFTVSLSCQATASNQEACLIEGNAPSASFTFSDVGPAVTQFISVSQSGASASAASSTSAASATSSTSTVSSSGSAPEKNGAPVKLSMIGVIGSGMLIGSLLVL